MEGDIFAKSYSRFRVDISSCFILSFPVAKSARNLGVIFDKNFTFHSNKSAVCYSCVYNIRQLRHIRCYRILDSPKLLVTALVSIRFDYFNSPLHGITDTDLTKLIQNQLGHTEVKSPLLTSSVPVLCSLHWLTVKFRILFKISLLTYKMLHEKQPFVLHCMLAASLRSRSLRSNKGVGLSVHRTKTNTGARAFHSCAPSLWNNLPLSVRSVSSVSTFKKHLKTHLSDLAFPP